MADKQDAMNLAMMLEWIRQNGSANIETLHGRVGTRMGLSVEGMRAMIEKAKKYGLVDEGKEGVVSITSKFSDFFEKGKGRAVEILQEATGGRVGAGEVARVAGEYTPVEKGKEIILRPQGGRGVRTGAEPPTSTPRRVGGPYKPVAEGQQIVRKEAGGLAKRVAPPLPEAAGAGGLKALMKTAGRVVLPLMLAFTVYDMTVGRGRREAEEDAQAANDLRSGFDLSRALSEERAKGQTIKNLVGVQAQGDEADQDFGRLALGAANVVGRAEAQTLGAMAKTQGVDAALIAKVLGL